MTEKAGPLLVRGRWVVTGAGQDDATLSGGAVLVRDGKVEQVGGWPGAAPGVSRGRGAGLGRRYRLPGLISAHHHVSGITQTQQGILDDILEAWLLEFRRLRPVDIYLDTLLTASRLLRSGVTSIVEMHRCGAAAEASAARIQQALRGLDAAGIRVAFAAGVADQNPLVNVAGPDEERLPGRAAGGCPAGRRGAGAWPR